MKRIKLAFLVLAASVMLLAASTAEAAKNKPKAPTSSQPRPDQNVYLEIGYPFVTGGTAGFSLGYERALSKDASWTVSGSFSSSKGDSFYSQTELDLGGMYRFYLGPHGKMHGPYAGPILKVGLLNYTAKLSAINPAFKDSSVSGTGIGLGGEGGYQWFLPNNFVFRAGADFTYTMVSMSTPSGAVGGGSSSAVTVKGSVGYAF